MFYQKYLPDPSLQPFIEWFYILETGQAEYQQLNAVANYNHALVFNYGECYRLSNKNYDGELLPLCFLSGISTEPYRLHIGPNAGMLGIIFRTAAFSDLLGVHDLEHWHDRRLDATSFLGNRAAHLCEQLAEARAHTARIRLANDFFLDMIARKTPQLTLADRAVNVIYTQRGMLTMDELARFLYASPRNLRRVFNDRIGVSPKFYARIKRFNYAHATITNRQHDWRSFLGDGGFYDQSHFIRDYRAFSGMPPTRQMPAGDISWNHGKTRG